MVHVSKMHELSGLVPLVKMVKQAAFLQQDKAHKVTSFQLVKITKLAETLNMTESTI